MKYQRLRWMAIAWVVWTLVFAIDVGVFSVERVVSPQLMGPLPPALAVLIRSVVWYSWWLWTPVIFVAARRYAFDSGRILRSTAAHLALSIVVVFSIQLISHGTRVALGLSSRLRIVSPEALLAYAAVCAVALVLQREHARQRGELEKAHLQAQLAQTQLQALTSQLHPHFLFNTMNGIAMLIRARENEQALDAMVAFGDLLRAAQMTGSGEVGLGEELAFVERYLRLEKMRFGDRLQSSISMSANDAGARVPSLLLQPLVENAIRHGFADLENGANLSVVAERHNDTLRLEVRDNGAGLPDGRRWEELAGIGLRNTSARLQSLYGPLHRFEVSSRPGAGTTVVIELPYQAMTA